MLHTWPRERPDAGSSPVAPQQVELGWARTNSHTTWRRTSRRDGRGEQRVWPVKSYSSLGGMRGRPGAPPKVLALEEAAGTCSVLLGHTEERLSPAAGPHGRAQPGFTERGFFPESHPDADTALPTEHTRASLGAQEAFFKDC